MNVENEQAFQFDVKAFLKTLTQRPGVYKMLDKLNKVIYIGKAKNLKKRVSSYFVSKEASPKQRAMFAHIAFIEVTVTHTEGEALLLESQFIKRYKPRYNICFRDDKSYPFIYVTTQQDFPRLTFHRGAKKKKGRYFGPYPSAGAVRESLRLLQRIFPVRQCEDSYFNNRSRPCLQYQIDRCTAPCVDLVDSAEYQQDVTHTLMFLEGNGNQLIEKLVEKMDLASNKLAFEKSAKIRDQIASLRTILEKQYVTGERGDLDIIACASRAGVACVQVFYVRKGQYLGDKTFFPAMPNDQASASVLEAFIPQYYVERTVPAEILISHQINNSGLLAKALSLQAKRKVSVSYRLRGERLKWLEMALTNAKNALAIRLTNKQSMFSRFLSLKEELGCSQQPKRLECFDISHIQGDQTVASCVVFDQEGPVKSDYRRFNIDGITPGDDYAAMAQVVKRRFLRFKKGEHEKPDIVLIDGGKGQVKAAQTVLDELSITDILIVGVSKGPDRRPGQETLIFLENSQAVDINDGSLALLLIQHIRDEAHRFAITGHRQRRRRVKKQSILESIGGLGPKRRQKILRQFGGLREVKKAGVNDLCGVEGISRQLAQRIYNAFHE